MLGLPIPMNPTALTLLRGRRLLLVQEKILLDPDLRRELSMASVEIVGPAASVGQVKSLLAGERRIDGAILDLSFRVEQAIAVTEELMARGIPFVFAADASSVDLHKRYPGYVLCRKPIFLEEIARALFANFPTEGSA